VIIAMPSVEGEVIRSVTRQADRMNAHLRIVPGIRKIIEGDVHWNQIRTVQPEDLLGRETVEVDQSRIRSHFRGKTVLVTGAAGSIGSQLVKQIAEHPVQTIYGVDINESGLYELEASELEPKQRKKFDSILGDIRERDHLEQIIDESRPDIVLHAAALKHVPMVERQPVEGFKTNVYGTLNVFELAVDHAVDEVVLISTDKAVSPENFMGMTKRIDERLVSTFHQKNSSTDFMAVRFGNVLGSRGSVVPLFQRQIEKGGPVTVTDPDVRRYFMTPTEAVKLVLMASVLRETPPIHVLELGDPIKILDLARQLIALSGYEPDTEIPITFTGLREGETMEETLFSPDEEKQSTEHPKIRATAAPVYSDEEIARIRNFLENHSAVESISLQDIKQFAA
ncbi:MAG: SDR family NAD(P)-dependent oxidoreductase, partial [bacterium]